MANIIAIDDQPEILELIQQALDGHAVKTSANGKDGLALIQRELPHLVILDVNMPGMDGLAVCRAIKDAAATRHIRVLMLTGEGKMRNVEEGTSMGADDYKIGRAHV